MDKKDIDKLTGDINENIETLKSSINEKANVKDLEKKFGEVNKKLDNFVDKDGNVKFPDSFTKQQDQLDDISTQIKQLEEHQVKKAPSLDEQLNKELKGMRKEDSVFQKGLKNPKIGEIGSMEIVKAADIDTDDINSGSIETQTEAGVARAAWRTNPLWAAVRKGTIGAGRDSISWWEETTRTDSAEMVAENAAPASGSAKTWTKQSMDIKMVKDYTKVSRSALEDFEYIKSEINDLLTNGIPRKREVQLWEGTGSGIYLKGIENYAKTFAQPANMNKVSNPNEADVLAAAILQVANGDTSDSNKKGYVPDLAIVNLGSITNMQLLKDSNGQYLLPPFISANGLTVSGVRVIPSLDLDADEFVVGSFSQAKVFVKRNMRISFHYENEDDVLNDLVLVMASQRLAGVRISTPGAFGFVTSTFSAAKSLIEKVVG